ncbi:MAG: hypothetical protein ACREQR_18205 [Candidatus Binataceae bacterium]
MRIGASKFTPRIRGLAALALALAWLTTLPACNSSSTGVSGFVGSTPPTAPETIFKVLGTVGTPFTLLVSNARSSWQIPGNVPLSVAILNTIQVNGLTPARMVATKLSNDNSLLSIQIQNGFNVIAASSTSAPFGTLTIKTGAPLPQISPPANPDLRIFVFGPAGERFQGLIEDSQAGFAVNQRVPALFLFDSPNGKVDGNFTQIQSFGPFAINMTFNGAVVATAQGFPNVIIRQP